MEDKFLIRAENGSFYLEIKEIFDFPQETCYWGGYDTKSIIEIKACNYFVRSSLYISTGEIYEFYEQLKTCST